MIFLKKLQTSPLEVVCLQRHRAKCQFLEDDFKAARPGRVKRYESAIEVTWTHFKKKPIIRECDRRVLWLEPNLNGNIWSFRLFLPKFCYFHMILFYFFRVSMPADTDHERSFQVGARERLATSVVQGGRSKNLLLAELGQELAAQRDSLNKRLQGN